MWILLNSYANSHAIAILFVDREDIPIAPLVLYSMLRSKTHQLRSLVSKPWNLEECYAKRPLSGQYSIEDRLSIGLYIRLRELFLVHLDVFDIPEDRREKTSGAVGQHVS